MPDTAKRHFDEDLARAESLVRHARALAAVTVDDRMLRDDVLRSGWMFAVGAMDAYFCDAYVAILGSTIMAKSLQPAIELPLWVRGIKIPIGGFLETYAHRPNWRWRMSIRGLMERDNVLSLSKVQQMFNPFFRDGHKLFRGVIDQWLRLPSVTARLLGTTRTAYLALQAQADRNRAQTTAVARLTARMEEVIQRRHDCIHNCDRPRVRPQAIEAVGTVTNVIRDVRFLVHNSDNHIDAEFRQFLNGIGCNAATRNAVGY